MMMTENAKLGSADDSQQTASRVMVAGASATKLSQGAQKKDAAKKDESDSPFAVSVSDVYEGPLDLLLDLIRKQDIDCLLYTSRCV